MIIQYTLNDLYKLVEEDLQAKGFGLQDEGGVILVEEAQSSTLTSNEAWLSAAVVLIDGKAKIVNGEYVPERVNIFYGHKDECEFVKAVLDTKSDSSLKLAIESDSVNRASITAVNCWWSRNVAFGYCDAISKHRDIFEQTLKQAKEAATNEPKTTA